MTIWSQSFPGLVLPACGVADGAFEVHNTTGRSLRQASHAYLCFECGPAGGVYHPEANRIEEHRADGALDDGSGWEPPTFEQVRAIAAELDAAYNRFELHRHKVGLSGQAREIEHSHNDGDDVHRHPDAGWATFEVTAAERKAYHFGWGGPAERPMTPAPKGPELEYVAPTDEERVFRVVGEYRYINPAESGAGTRTKRVGDRGPRPREGTKPPSEWSRAAWRDTIELQIQAARLQLYGHEPLLIGPGAITLTALRMALHFRLTPVYEIRGWQPTPYVGLP